MHFLILVHILFSEKIKHSQVSSVFLAAVNRPLHGARGRRDAAADAQPSSSRAQRTALSKSEVFIELVQQHDPGLKLSHEFEQIGFLVAV